MIDCDAITSRRLANANATTERVYWRVYMASDNYGVMQGDPWHVWQNAAPGMKGMNEALIEAALDALVECDLLTVWEADGKTWLHVKDHDRVQSSDFIRKRGVRRTPEPPAISNNARVGESSGELGARTTTTTTTTKISSTNVLSPDENAGNPAAVAKRIVREVFEHWRTAFNKRSTTNLDAKRERAIRRACALVGKDDAIRCLDGYASDPWRHCELARHEIATLFRDAAHIERGLDLALGNNATTVDPFASVGVRR